MTQAQRASYRIEQMLSDRLTAQFNTRCIVNGYTHRKSFSFPWAQCYSNSTDDYVFFVQHAKGCHQVIDKERTYTFDTYNACMVFLVSYVHACWYADMHKMFIA